MKADRISVRGRTLVRLFVVVSAVLGLSLEVTSAQKNQRRVTKADPFGGVARGSGVPRGVVRGGPGLPRNLELPVLPPITVDYRNDEATRARRRGDVTVIGGGRAAVRGPVAGQVCFDDIQCDDCDPCTEDSCTEKLCVGGPEDGRACEVDDDCGGSCVGGNDDGGPCAGDLDCCGDSPETDGFCDAAPCIGLGEVTCVHWPFPLDVPAEDCDDGVQCNGAETCEAGVCAPGTPVCPDEPGTVCDEINGPAPACVTVCAGDAGCDDGLLCNGAETCNGTTGLCESAGSPCGPGGLCQEPGDGETEAQCEPGRCCDAAGSCTDVTFAQCNSAGGAWVAIVPSADACATFENTDIFNICPVYGGGIAPQGNFIVSVGPISNSSCNVDRVGDDYSIEGADYIDIELFRFAADVVADARFAIEFYDADFRLIEDVFFPDGTNALETERAIFTVDFDPSLTIPTNGFVAFSVQRNFGPDGRVAWISTDAVDVGGNDAGRMFVNGAEVSDFLGRCDGGTRDRLWCDRGNQGNALVGCPDGGTCVDVPDVLAFEIVGPLADAAPLSACCDSTSGECSLQLPWICELSVAEGGVGGVSQGIGTLCATCAGNGFTSCEADADCLSCQNPGGDQDGMPCDPSDFFSDCAFAGGQCGGCRCDNNGSFCDPNDADPCGGGTCECCLPFRPACTTNGCCDPATGVCTVVVGGVCQGGNDPPDTTCLGDSDCDAGTCEPACPSGSEAQGFGTSCEPDCCEQPVVTGGDNCMEVTPTPIAVPLLGEPPVSVTFSGNNATATFDDWFTRTCEGGDNEGLLCKNRCDGGDRDGLLCDPEADNPSDPGIGCPDGGTCGSDDCTGGACTGDQLCGFGGEPPDNGPNWWEGFSINDCAVVRIDYCCSDPIIRPAFGNLLSDCPCERNINNSGVDPPVGPPLVPGGGRGSQGFARGAPFCNEDNLWGTYGPLAPGEYYYPIPGDPGFTSASGPHGPGADYQLHVTVGACPVLACCSTLCEGGTRDGLPCAQSGLDECPDSQCVGGVCASGILAGFACDEDSVDQCGGGTCADTAGCAEVNQLECEMADGFWLGTPFLPDGVDDIVSCLGSPCTLGTCCLGPGECRDTATPEVPCDPSQPATCMNEVLCEDILEGTFSGGKSCDFADRGALEPCPACPIQTDENCVGLHANGFFQNDRNVGLRFAEDFVPTGSQVTQFCFFPCFWDVIETTQIFVAECPAGATRPPDDFVVRFWRDDNGVPGALIPQSPGPVTIDSKIPIFEDLLGVEEACWEYSVILDTPVPVTPGVRHWVSWSGKGNSDCQTWTWAGPSLDGSTPTDDPGVLGNNYFGLDFDAPADSDDPGSWGPEDMVNGVGVAFCVDSGYDDASPENDEPLGACCECDGTCTDAQTLDRCFPADIPFEDSAADFPRWHPGLGCGEITCLAGGAGGDPCRPTGNPPGENCSLPQVVADGSFRFFNDCSDTDGPLTYSSCDNEDFNTATNTSTFINDLWFEYVATCDGRLTMDTCRGGDFDSVMAVYSNPDGSCPAACPPPEETLVGGQCKNFGPSPCQNAELVNHPNIGAQVLTFTSVGTCYLIRVGGVNDVEGETVSAGTALLTVDCNAGACELSDPPELLQIQDQVGGNNLVALARNRLIGLTAGAPGRSHQIRVTFVDLPAPFNVWNGTVLWVSALSEVCNLPGVADPDNASCTSTFTIASLSCDESEALALDWSTVGEFFVVHPGIVPSSGTTPATYEVAIMGSDCDPTDPTSFAALEVVNSLFGDITGLFDPGAGLWVAPDDLVGIPTDILASIAGFANTPGNPTKLRADGEPCILDFKINIIDIVRFLDGFRGLPFPFGPGVLDCPQDPCAASGASVAVGP